MPSPSPHMATQPSPRASASPGEALRPTVMKRHSSQSSHNSNKHGALSPGSVGEQNQHSRHVVKPRATKIVLPRAHGSGRNLAKMGRQHAHGHGGGAGGAAMERKGSRQKSQDASAGSGGPSGGGSDRIRLPGSLEGESQRPAQQLRRNLTASQLPRNTSHTKLKKNLSHGQLTRLGSGRNLAGLNERGLKGPPSPRLRDRNRRPKSSDGAKREVEKDLHEQEVEIAEQRREQREGGPKKVGFAVGSSGDDDDEDSPEMEGSGMQEDEWTDQSASASPYSTRQNTANNSRRGSVTLEGKAPPDRNAFKDVTKERKEGVKQNDYAVGQGKIGGVVSSCEGTEDESDEDKEDEQEDDEEDEEDDEEPASPKSMPQVHKNKPPAPSSQQTSPEESKTPQRSPLHGAKEHPNPATRHLLSRANNTPTAAPALVSNVSALDANHSARGSPAPSMTSSRSNIGGESVPDQEREEELVSRFIPSTSHPSTLSGTNTMVNTPKTGSFHTPENESTLLASRNREKQSATSLGGPVSPGSTLSGGGSSGVTTPAIQRSRNEQKMMNEKMQAELDDLRETKPSIPPHVYDRRNVSLKSYLRGSSSTTLAEGEHRGSISGGGLIAGLNMGPELFQGRFKAVNTELKVVQKFRDPIGESLGRLRECRDVRFSQLRSQKTSAATAQQKAQMAQGAQATKVPTSKSALQLSRPPTSKLSTSTSPPPDSPASAGKPSITSAKSTTQIKGSSRPPTGGGGDSRRGKVTFSEAARPPSRRGEENGGEGGAGAKTADAIAREMWEGIFA